MMIETSAVLAVLLNEPERAAILDVDRGRRQALHHRRHRR